MSKIISITGVTLGMGALFVLWRGWSIALLWGWYVVPLGAPPISLLHGIGLGLLLYVVLGDLAQRDYSKLSPVQTWLTLGMTLLGPVVLGWLVHELMLRGIGS